MRAIGNITIRNQTSLADYSAIIRAGLYMAGQIEEAEEGGYRFCIRDTFTGRTVRVSEAKEEPAGTAIPTGPSN